MTLTEAYELLDLPEGTDLQQVRQRFIEQHSEYRMQIDNAPTPNLRQRYEKNLALREEAFNLVTGGSSLDDSQDLPSSALFEQEKEFDSKRENNIYNENSTPEETYTINKSGESVTAETSLNDERSSSGGNHRFRHGGENKKMSFIWVKPFTITLSVFIAYVTIVMININNDIFYLMFPLEAFWLGVLIVTFIFCKKNNLLLPFLKSLPNIKATLYSIIIWIVLFPLVIFMLGAISRL